MALVDCYKSIDLTHTAFIDNAKEFFKESPLLYVAVELKNSILLREKILKNLSLDKRKYVRVSYEDFCKNPKKLYDTLIERFLHYGYDCRSLAYKGPESFNISPRVPTKEVTQIVDEVFGSDKYNLDFLKD